MAKIVVTEEMNPIGPSLLKQAGHQVIEGWTISKEEMLKELRVRLSIISIIISGIQLML